MTDLARTDAFMPALTLQQAIERRNAIVEFTAKIMRPNVDYGKVPGTDKDVLLKPGAEKLCTQFGLAPVFERIDCIRDWTGQTTGGEPLFYFEYRCRLYRNGAPIGEGIGSCNSWEKKYRYRKAERLCPACGTAAIIKGKADYGGGWLCFAKKGGCSTKYRDDDPAIVQQEVGYVANPDIFDIINTIDKMAQKRALIAATLIALNASEFFTQDLDEQYIDAPYTVQDGSASYQEPQQRQSASDPAVDRQTKIESIKALWAEDERMGGRRPAKEQDIDLNTIKVGDLVALEKSVQQRVEYRRRQYKPVSTSKYPLSPEQQTDADELEKTQQTEDIPY